MPILSYNNDPALKEKYLARVSAHAEADEIIKGQYWENGKGCAVGCTIHSSNHAAYEEEIGPEWLARLEDTLFEGMENGDAKAFPLAFLQAIPVGVNLERVKWQFCAFLLTENIERVLTLDIDDTLKRTIVDAIRGVLAVHEQAIESNRWNESAAESAAWSAESAARSAAWSARSAAWSARSAESARSAAWSAWSAWSAESAARSARSAESAESAAWSAWSAESAARSARSAAYKRYADHLLSLLRAAKSDQ